MRLYVIVAAVCVLIVAAAGLWHFSSQGPVIEVTTFKKEVADRLIPVAETGNSEACICLYDYYERSPGKGLKWLRRALEKGNDPRVQFVIYSQLMTSSLPWRRREALEMLRKAASAGLPEAEETLGNCYRFGRLVRPDAAVAEYWYRKSALHGLETAMISLSVLLYQTKSDKVSLVEAYVWSTLVDDPATSLSKERGEKIIGKAVQLGFDQSDIITQAESLVAETKRKIAPVHFPEVTITRCVEISMGRR
jgi:TPR repeat protein